MPQWYTYTNCWLFYGDIRVFKEQFQSSVALAQVPDAGKVGHLEQHLNGGTLSFFLNYREAAKHFEYCSCSAGARLH